MPENEIEIPPLPNLRIVKDGKQVDTSAIDNFDPFMSYIMLASIASNQAKVRRIEEDKVSKGEVESWWITATPVVQEVRCNQPCQSIHFICDGPGALFIIPNNYMDTPAPLNQRDEYTLNFETHTLRRFYVYSADGTTSTFRAWAKY